MKLRPAYVYSETPKLYLILQLHVLHTFIAGASKKKRPAFEKLLLLEYISNDILQYLIKQLTFSIIFRNFPG